MANKATPGERASLDYIRGRYHVPAEVGGRVTVYTGEQGTIVGACPQATHYLHVLLDGDDEPIILHPTWEITYHCDARASSGGAA